MKKSKENKSLKYWKYKGKKLGHYGNFYTKYSNELVILEQELKRRIIENKRNKIF